MPAFKLSFASSPHFELTQSEFLAAPGKRPCRAVRGKTAGAYREHNTFQWTSAVQALSIILLREKAWALQNRNGEEPILSGEGGSPAASLDYALGKQPEWLCEMFGADAAGQVLARRLFKRTNPERKRGGPVSIALNRNLLQPEEISIFVDDLECLRAGAILQLADALEREWHIRAAGADKKPVKNTIKAEVKTAGARRKNRGSAGNYVAPFNNMEDLEQLHQAFADEINWGLTAVEIFVPGRYTAALSRIAASPTLKRISNGHIERIKALASAMSNAERLGAAQRKHAALLAEATAASALIVRIPPAMTGAVALFTYLQKVKGYNIKVDYSHARAIDIVNSIINGKLEERPDCCITGIASTGTLLGYGDISGFEPVLLMPKLSYCIIGPAGDSRKSGDLNKGVYRLVTDSPAGASFYFDQLLKVQLIEMKRIKIVHTEADEATLALLEGTELTRAVMPFPMHYFCEKYAGARILHSSKKLDVVNETTLFAGPAITANPALRVALQAAVRDAWLTLREDRQALVQTVRLMLEDTDYVRYLARLGGVPHMMRSKMER